MENDIKHLIQLISENDDQLAFGELYRHFFPGLFSFVNAIVKDKQEAEEVVLDVFTKLWENRKTLRKIQNLSGYLYTSVKYTAISLLRKQKHLTCNEITETAAYSLVTPESKLISKESLSRINEGINSLPPKCRLIFRLVKDERLKYAEVAELLNISVKTVEAQVYIATKKLLEILRKPFSDMIAGDKVKK